MERLQRFEEGSLYQDTLLIYELKKRNLSKNQIENKCRVLGQGRIQGHFGNNSQSPPTPLLACLLYYIIQFQFSFSVRVSFSSENMGGSKKAFTFLGYLDENVFSRNVIFYFIFPTPTPVINLKTGHWTLRFLRRVGRNIFFTMKFVSICMYNCQLETSA